MARSLTLPLAAAVAAAILLAGSPVAAAPRDIDVELSADKADLTTSDDVFVRFSLRNAGEQGRSVYLWDTPLVEVENDLFSVTRDGESVAYLGFIAKRGAPTRADYVRLGPGQSRSVVVELSALYDMSQPGAYAIRYRGSASNELNLQITGEARGVAVTPQGKPGGGTQIGNNIFVSCSASQQTDLQTARPAAQSYASGAYSSLNGSAGARYTTWFGTYDSGRYSTVKSHFDSLDSALTNEIFTFNCGCKKQYYAYVYPTRPYEVFLCRAFWSAPMTGTDSKAGTIIHETSHFNVVASTDDWAYGQSACKSLAISDPVKAVDNADSHEYYAENTPPLN